MHESRLGCKCAGDFARHVLGARYGRSLEVGLVDADGRAALAAELGIGHERVGALDAWPRLHRTSSLLRPTASGILVMAHWLWHISYRISVMASMHCASSLLRSTASGILFMAH